MEAIITLLNVLIIALIIMLWHNLKKRKELLTNFEKLLNDHKRLLNDHEQLLKDLGFRERLLNCKGQGE